MIVAGCASRVGLNSKLVTADLVHKSVRENHERVKTMKGSGRITVETPALAQAGSFELVVRKPDSVLVKLEGPFGIDVGSALLTRKDFLFYNSFQNQVITGATTAANLSRILRVNLDFDDLLTLFTGGAFFSDDELEPDAFAVQDEQYVLAYHHTDGDRRYWIDPTSLLVTKIQHFDTKGKLQFEQGFSNFRTVGGSVIPFRVRMRQHDAGRAVSVAYSTIAINTNSIQFTFHIPESAARIRWQ